MNKIEGVNESFVYGKVDPEDPADVKVCAKLVYDKDTVKKAYGVKGKDEIKEALWERVKEINKSMPTYKYIKEITITEEELIKTTTQKIKRHVELEKTLAK